MANQLPFPFNIREGDDGVERALFHEAANSSPTRRNRRNGIAAPIWCRARRIAAPAIRRRPSLGGDKTERRLQGYAMQGWFAPDITDDTSTGLGGWTVDDIAAYLKTGHNGIAAATGLMAEEVDALDLADDRRRSQGDRDLSQVVAGSRGAATALAASDPRMQAGGAIYADQCSACHGRDGDGASSLFPALARFGRSCGRAIRPV